MPNVTINLPIILTLCSGLAWLLYSYWIRVETAVIPATIPIVKEEQ